MFYSSLGFRVFGFTALGIKMEDVIPNKAGSAGSRNVLDDNK